MIRAAWSTLTLLSVALTAQTAVDPEEFVHLEAVLQRAMRIAAPFVVTVETFGGTRKVLADNDSAGSAPPNRVGAKPRAMKDPGFHQAQGRSAGIVLSKDGWIMVARFALNYDPTSILVTVQGGKTFHADRKGEDTSRGIALLKIDAIDLVTAELVLPNDVRVGQWAFAIGRTFGGLEPTVHLGIVSALRRQFGRALQIDAYTSPANYGGAVVDITGRVLGIAVPLSPTGRDAGVEWYDSGIGFAATLADIPELIERMKRGENIHRGWLGVEFEQSHLGPGAKLSGTPKDGVAAQAGLRKGDVILEIDGILVKNGAHLQMLLGARMGGEAVGMKVRQKTMVNDPIAVTVILADTSDAQREQSKEAELPASFPLPEKQEGR
ncbi:MAG: trypsin-like peptidase domain-containing protein [Planctomycetota bacterium]